MFDRFLRFQARQRPQAPAIVTSTRRISFVDLDRAVDSVTLKIAGRSFGKGDVVAVGGLHPIRHWTVLLALSRIGVASGCIADAKATFRISGVPIDDGIETLHATERWFSAVETADVPSALPTPDGDALGRVLLSSGTIGSPKRIGLSWAMIDRNVRNAVIAYGPVVEGAWHFEVPVDSVFGFTVPVAAWACGQAVSAREDGRSVIPLLREGPPALLALVPFVLRGILAGLPEGFEPLPRMRVISMGAPLSAAMARDARRRLSPDLRTVYGASECSVATILDARHLEDEPNAAGYPMPDVTVGIADEDDEAVAPGAPGQVRVRSPRVVGRYLDMDRPSTAFRGGWFYPGDIGRIRGDGMLLIEGRTDDVLNIGGVKIVAGVVEDLARPSPGLSDVAAFAVPTGDGVNQLWLALVVGDGYDQEALVANIVKGLPYTPTLRAMRLDRLPRNDMGKVMRSALVDLVRGRPANR